MVAVPSSEVAGFQGEAQAQSSGRSLRQIVWARLRRDRLAMVCLVVLVLFYLTAVVGPVVAGIFLALLVTSFIVFGPVQVRRRGDQRLRW